MANVLSNLAADIYVAADKVGRELVGVVPSATLNSDASQRVAKGDTIRSHFTRKPTVNSSYTPSMTIPEGNDQTVDNKTFAINQVANVQIPWTGEDIKHVNNGSGFETIYGDQIAQAMRAIVNTIEAYAAVVVKQGASRAYGTAGTTPFGSNFDEVAEIRQILVDNGCPMDGNVSMVLNTLAGTKLRNLAQLQKANESGGTELLRQGLLLDLQGIKLKESGGIVAHTKGTGASYAVNKAGGYAVGNGCFGNTAPLDGIVVDTGAGTILAGDIITAVGDTNKYVVNSALSGGTFSIGGPGLRQTLADDVVLSVGNNYTPNMAFHKSAVEIAFRPPAQPYGGDAAVDRMTVQDPFSGIVFEIAAYKGYGKAMFDITTFYDAKAWKSDNIALLLG